jgi:restriction endonuclease Mrr
MFRAAILITREVSGEETVEPPLPEPNFLNLTSFEFEQLVVGIFQQTGFATVSQPNVRGDGGIDIIALNNSPLVGGRVAVTAKRYRPERKVGIADVRELIGSMAFNRFTKGIIITTSGFTAAARQAAESSGIELYDGERFRWLLHQHLRGEFTITGRSRRKPRLSKPRRLLLRILKLGKRQARDFF